MWKNHIPVILKHNIIYKGKNIPLVYYMASSLLKLCTPALVYLVISVILLVFLIFSGSISALTLIMKSALIVLWTLLLNWLCSRGLGVLSWIIVLLPVILVVLLASWSVDVQSRFVPSWSQTSMRNAARVGGCSSCREGLDTKAPAPATTLSTPPHSPATTPPPATTTPPNPPAMKQ